MAGDFLPKPVRLKRISASCASPFDWIDVSIQPGYSGSKSTRRRVETRHFTHDESSYEDQLKVSPTSSPEFDYALGSGHEFLGIEVDEHQTALAIPSSLHISDSGSCCSSQRSTTVTEICSSQPSGKPTAALCDRDSEDFECLNSLQGNELTSLYLNLSRKPTRQKEMKSGLTSRIRLLARRSYSERSMWLHRHTLLKDYDTTVHTSRIFRVSRCDASRPSGLPGLHSFIVTELFSDEATEHLGADTSAVSSILLPVSGNKLQFGTSVLGDNINPNDAIRVYSPWCASTDPSNPDSSVLHSFFWAEHVKPTELASCLRTTSCSEPPETARISLVCQCSISSSSTDFRSCRYRFRPADSEIENVFEPPFVLEALKNPIVVLATSQLWLTQKIRQSLVVLHHTLGLGVIVMPSTWNPVANTAPNTDSPMQTRAHPSANMKLGGLYTVENLFQLTSCQLPQCFKDDAYSYFADTRRILCGSSSRRLSHFMENWDFSVFSDSSTSNPCCLWDARIASFRLVRACYVRIPEPPQFSVTLPLFSRCHLDGLLLSEVPAGSLLFLDVIQRLRSLSIPNTSSASDDACRLTQSFRHATRLFFLSIADHGATSMMVVPCICLSSVPSPLNVIRNSYTKKSYSGHVLPSSYGYRLTVTNAYIGPGCVFVDLLASIRTRNRKPLSRPSRFNILAANVYKPLESVAKVSSLQLHDLVQFSGTIVSVDTNRSHTWPVCAFCLSDGLQLTGARQLENEESCSISTKLSSNCPIFQCSLCGSHSGETLHSFELEVLITLDTVKDVTSARPQVLLIMSPARLFKILGLPGNALPKDLQLNPKLMLSKRIERTAGLVVRVNDNHPFSSRPLPVTRVSSILDLGLGVLE